MIIMIIYILHLAPRSSEWECWMHKQIKWFKSRKEMHCVATNQMRRKKEQKVRLLQCTSMQQKLIKSHWTKSV